MYEEAITTDQGISSDTTWSAEPFHLTIGGFGPRALWVARVRGREALSHPYAWTVTFTAADPMFQPSLALGQPARLTIAPLADAPREVFGVVAAIEARGGSEHGHSAYRARIVPRLARLRHRRWSRVFEGRTVLDILTDVLEPARVAHRFETRAAYARRAYCVQYRETDLAFVRRLCAEVGIWFRFDAPSQPEADDASEVVVFGDSAAAPEMEGGGVVRFATSGGPSLSAEDNHVTRFEPACASTPAAITLHGYDFRRPRARLHARAVQRDDRAAEVYEHHDTDEDATKAESGLEQAFLAQLARDARTASGTSTCARLAPGRRFVLDVPGPGTDNAHVVTAIEHTGRAPRLANGRLLYGNRFRCVPASEVPRPPRPAPKVQAVTETAIVVGPEGSEIHTDEHGRVRVRFHWQIDDAVGDRAACWARVAEAWAGTAWGSQIVPRVGMEVLVAFLGGDASRPVVLGCLRNATHPVPFALPRDKARSGIRTRSTPGGEGYNELSFCDAKGAELVCVRAERDLTSLVVHDAREEVGHDHAFTVGHDRRGEIVGSDSLTVRERLTLEVAGTALQEMSDQRVAHTTSGGAGVVLSGGSASLTARTDIHLRAGGDITLDAAGNITIKAGGVVTIRAAGAVAIEGTTLTAGAGGAVVLHGGTVDINP